MSNTKVSMDDERLKYITREHPEITFAAAEKIRMLLEQAEDRGREYAAENLGPELEEVKSKARKESADLFGRELRTLEWVRDQLRMGAESLERDKERQEEARLKREQAAT